MQKRSSAEKQNKTELTRKAMIGLKAEATARGQNMKEVASELILAGISPQARAFVQSIVKDIEELPSRPTVTLEADFDAGAGQEYVSHEGQDEAEFKASHEAQAPSTQETKEHFAAQTKSKNKTPIEFVPGLGDQIKGLKAKGMSIRDIASEVGYGKSAVQKYLAKQEDA